MRKNAKQYVQLTCKTCGQLFNKEKKEYDRQVRFGNLNFYCNLKCSGQTKVSKPDAPFKFMVKAAKKAAKSRHRECTLTPQEIETIWNRQNGRCAYTNLQLILPTYKHISSPLKASLDRIDSSKGYTMDNVEIVCVFVNLGKNGFPKEEIVKLLNDFKGV